jgi:hypothetical protein
MGSSIGAGPPAVLAILAMAAPALAQPPLAELAREEQERRASISEKSRVYTNDDLLGGLRLTTGALTSAGAESQEPGPSETATTSEALPPDEGETAQQDEGYWRQRITAAREGRQRAELLAAALQNRVDGLWADFTARDDPFQRAQIERDRLDALAELEHTRGEVDRSTQEISDIREEARRGGVPPGWLR